MRELTLTSGRRMPVLGLGTWRMGEQARQREAEVAAVRLALDLGLRLIDTAEMYGEGGAEKVVGEAIAGRRDEVFLVSKVYPHNASRKGAVAACERSLRRLKVDRIDLHLLHWRGSYPLADTVAAFEQLKEEGKIADWGVSNLSVADMAELKGVAPAGACVANQVLYHLGERGIEWDLLPEMQRQGIVTMAYSPLGAGAILKSKALVEVARRHAVDPATLAIAWVLRQKQTMTIPKSARPEGIKAIVAALDVELTAEDLAKLDAAFAPPTRAMPLATS